MGRNTSFFVTIQILLGFNNTHFHSRIKLHANESETEEIKRKHTHIPFARHQPVRKFLFQGENYIQQTDPHQSRITIAWDQQE